jgi:Zn-dependent M28 family amino/carboxypeptidase
MLRIQEREATSQRVHSRGGAGPDAGRLRGWVERLAIPRHIFANARNNSRVRDALARAFDELGLSVQIQGRFQNVVALPRAAHGQPTAFIAAHYDSVPDCPGADDNASGLAVMLECARVLTARGTGRHRPVGFIAFNAEEDGLLGSRDFVTHGLPALRIHVHSVHVLEMVGFLGGSGVQEVPLPWVPASLKIPNFIGLVGKGRSNASLDRAMSQVVAPGLRVLAAKTWGPLHRLVPDLTRSDHFPFWDGGLPALLWTDTGNFRNPHYHRPTDTPDTLDYAFMRDVAELLCATVSEEAQP